MKHHHSCWFILRGGYSEFRKDWKFDALATLNRNHNADEWWVNVYGA